MLENLLHFIHPNKAHEPARGNSLLYKNPTQYYKEFGDTVIYPGGGYLTQAYEQSTGKTLPKYTHEQCEPIHHALIDALTKKFGFHPYEILTTGKWGGLSDSGGIYGFDFWGEDHDTVPVAVGSDNLYGLLSANLTGYKEEFEQIKRAGGFDHEIIDNMQKLIIFFSKEKKKVELIKKKDGFIMTVPPDFKVEGDSGYEVEFDKRGLEIRSKTFKPNFIYPSSVQKNKGPEGPLQVDGKTLFVTRETHTRRNTRGQRVKEHITYQTEKGMLLDGSRLDYLRKQGRKTEVIQHYPKPIENQIAKGGVKETKNNMTRLNLILFRLRK